MAVEFPDIRNITVSGRIATGATTLAKQLAEILQWKFLDGSRYNDEFFKKIGQNEVNVNLRPDEMDRDFDEHMQHILRYDDHYVVQSHLAGFKAQGIEDVYKVLTLCNDKDGKDQTEIRVDRLVNRKGISVHQAKKEIKDREAGNLEKWRRMYVPHDPDWVYWEKRYYDLIVNTYFLNKQDSLEYVLQHIGFHS